MNFLELRQLVSFYVDDLAMTYFTPIQVNRFLNNAHREAQKLLLGAGQDYFTRCATTDLVVNQSEYVLPEDFYKVNRLEVVISGVEPNINVQQLTKITPNQQNLVSIYTGTPQVYYMKRNRFVLLPFPDQALKLRMDYTPKVIDMVDDTDQPQIPEPYHEFLAILAAADCLLKDGRDPSTLFNKRDYYLQMMKDDAAQRQLDSSRYVITSGNYVNDSEGWIY